MLDSDEIYRRCHNNYGMEKDEIEALVLKGTEYSKYDTDEEKLNAFYSDLLEANKVKMEDSETDLAAVPEDDVTLEDAEKDKVEDIKKRLRTRSRGRRSLDEEAFEAAGAHLAPGERGSFKDLMKQLREMDELPDEPTLDEEND
jgi:hypothetical protein